jgi:hypothetical protein
MLPMKADFDEFALLVEKRITSKFQPDNQDMVMMLVGLLAEIWFDQSEMSSFLSRG